MHLLQYILFLSLSYVNHVYLNWPKGTETFLVPAGFVWYAIIDLNRLIRLCGCNCVRFIFWPRIFLLTSWKIIFSVDFFQILHFLGGILLPFDSFRYNRDPSMKNTESIGWLYDWFTFSSDYVRGMKQKLRTSRNKISMQIPVTGARCTIVWAIRDGNAPYWCTHHFFNGPYQILARLWHDPKWSLHTLYMILDLMNEGTLLIIYCMIFLLQF
jgi:hypothetical protein